MMKTVDEELVTEEMLLIGGALLSRRLSSFDVIGGWSDEEVLPDVFRAMLAAAPECRSGSAQEETNEISPPVAVGSNDGLAGPTRSVEEMKARVFELNRMLVAIYEERAALEQQIAAAVAEYQIGQRSRVSAC